MNDKFDNIIRQRVYSRVPIKELADAGITEFYVGGNSLNKNPPNDIDVFPVGDLFTSDNANKLGSVICSTKNATTVKVAADKTLNHQTVDGQNPIEVNGKLITVQLCNYKHGSLEDLVNSFDFAHIQIGVKVTPNNIDVYYTKEYEESKLCQSTDYRGSEYPISSLIRAFKYAKRGDFAGDSHIFSVLKILTDICHRGFEDYDDFKNQLDAVDLGLVPENEDALEEAGLNFSESADNVLNKLMTSLTLGKKALAKDAQLSYDYAKVMGERFLPGETAISKDARLSLLYAKDVIKGRFELGEKSISQNSQCIWSYYSSLQAVGIKLPEDLHNIMLGLSLGNDNLARMYVRNYKEVA